MNAPKTFQIKSFGCQMNVYDGERMAELLGTEGMTPAAPGTDADVVVLNTCHIREKAAEKAYSEVGRLRREDGSKPVIALAGCVAQAEGAEAKRRSKAIDLVVGPQAYHRLPQLLREVDGGARPVDTDLPTLDKFAALPARRRSGVSAFLSVQEGCDKFCTYCVVPYTRGAEVSRPVSDLLVEAEQLVAGGCRELTLLGQNVNAWEDGSETLATLIRRLDDLPNLERIRYTTSHPINMGDDLIAAHRDVAKLMPYLHLPVQSGSNRILRAMNRHHTSADYLRVLDKVRAARPDIALSGDFIVGFPGETEQDFEATLEIVREVGYAAAFSFKYSARPGTPAATMGDQVPEAIKDERLQRLQALLAEQGRRFNASKIGQTTRILIDRVGRKPGQMIGKSPWLQSVFVETDAKIGDMVDVRLTAALPNSLAGEIVAPRQQAA
jgi:tRNA-2-methylthio-N6-dimethylallyladenosine synthase